MLVQKEGFRETTLPKPLFSVRRTNAYSVHSWR
jgi:hypothetical protein